MYYIHLQDELGNFELIDAELLFLYDVQEEALIALSDEQYQEYCQNHQGDTKFIDGKFVFNKKELSNDELLMLAKSDKLTQINSQAQAYINQKAGLNDVPEFEVQTWTIQALEAKAWHEDNNTPTSTLETIAQARGVPVDILRQKAYKKAIKFEKLSAYVAGVRQRLTDLVDKAVSVDELDKIVIEFALPENTKQ